MLQLADGKFAPFTFSIGFVAMPFEAAIDFYTAWHNKFAGSGTKVDPVSGRVSSWRGCLEPLTMPPSKRLLISTRSKWCALIDNSSKGADPSGPIGVAVRATRCDGIRISSIPNTLSASKTSKKGTFGASFMEYYSGKDESPLRCSRAIGILNDGGRWRFINEGRPFNFEQTDRYISRQVGRRFDDELMLKYCLEFDLHPFEEDFYLEKGVKFDWSHCARHETAKLTLEEAQAQLGMTSNKMS